MDGDAREWYADYFKQHGAVPTWKTLINAFSKYFSTQGRGEKNLHDAWRKLTFTPDTDEVEVFIRDIQELVKQLEYSDQVLKNHPKSSNAQRNLWDFVPDGRAE